MECKVTIQVPRLRSDLVLIETLWNVKIEYLPPYSSASFVLIETLWNVKLFKNRKCIAYLRINRNIVECKGEKVLAARNEEIEY